MASNCKMYESTVPALVIPDHFFCNRSSKLVVIYDEPIGEEEDVVTLMFPGDISGNSPKTVKTERIGTRTLVLDTPVYSSCRGVVEVLPLLNLQNGEVAQLAHFKLTLKHPIRNVMELCLNLSTNNAILPVLLSLMVHCQDDNYKEHFQDPHVDRVMATLVGSRTPGDSTCIQDIILPSRKWRRLNLAEFARHFHLTEMEKQAYILNKQRSKWASKAKNSPKRSKTILRSQTTDVEGGDLEGEDEHAGERLHQHLSSSTPDIHTIDEQEQRDSGVSDDSDVIQRFMRGAKFVCRVVEDFIPDQDNPSCIPLRVNQEVHIVQDSNSEWWYGVCDDRCGYFPPSSVQPVRAPTKLRSITISEASQHLSKGKQLSESFREELSSHRLRHINLSPPLDRPRTESERSDGSQLDSLQLGRHSRLKTNPNHLMTGKLGSGLKRREGGFQSDSGTTEVRKPAFPSSKQQLLQKQSPILPPFSHKSYRSTHSTSSYQPTSPTHADSANSAGDESTNVDSSESDGYEDVMSGDDEEAVVKSQWTGGRKTTPPTAVPSSATPAQMQPFALPFMRDKVLPKVPDQPSPSHKQNTRSQSDSNYEEVIVPASDYVNIAMNAFEIVDDHIYDCAEVLNKDSAIYQITASSAHVKAVTQMALYQSQKQNPQVDCQRTESESLDHKSGRQWQREHINQSVAMSPRTAAFVPPRDVPRTNMSPVHRLNTTHDSTGNQPKWKGPTSPPHSQSPTAVSTIQESPLVPTKTFAFPTIPPKDSERFDIPTSPQRLSSKASGPTPPQKMSKPGASPQRANPMLPPKQIPVPPPKILNPVREAPYLPRTPDTALEAPRPPPRAPETALEAPRPPPRAPETALEAPRPPPRAPETALEAPRPPPRAPETALEASRPPQRASEAPQPPPRSPDTVLEAPHLPLKAPEPVPAAPVVPPKGYNQSNSPVVHPKPSKRPAAVPIPPPKPSKQEPPLPPPKTMNTHNSNGNDHGQSGLGGHHTYPQARMKMLPANEIAFLAAARQQGSMTMASKRYHKPLKDHD